MTINRKISTRLNSTPEYWENREVRIDKRSGLVEAIISWTPEDEVNYVRRHGTGYWSDGSNMRHKLKWWMENYLKVTDLPELRNKKQIIAGRKEAKKILSGL